MRDFYVIRTRRAVVGDRLRGADIAVESGQIARIADRGGLTGGDIIDVEDDVVMPGLIDAHVHINEPGRTHWEGFETATKAACAGGITAIVDMPLNSSPVTTTADALDRKRRAAEDQLWVDCGFYGGLVPENDGELEPLIDAGVLGIKAFLCHSGIDEFPASKAPELRRAMPVLARRNLPLLVHAELVDDIDRSPPDPTDYAAYAAGRPPEWEVRAIELLIEHCRRTGCAVHVVHLAASDALEVLRDARSEGLPITVETCPHYLNFRSDEIPDADPRYKCAPPIRDRHNRRRLQNALLDGDIDLVATDHSPSPPSLKNLDTGDVHGAWGGIASLQLLLPAVWTAVRNRGATPVDVAHWTSRRPARLLGLDDRLGTIATGRPANLVVWDPDAPFVVDANELYHRHPITPYDGKQLYGVVRSTYLRGQQIYDGSTVTSQPRGKELLRQSRSDQSKRSL